MQSSWETVSCERHFANPHLEVVTDQVRTPSRSLPRAWTVVHRKAAVIIAPMTREGKIVLIHQERIPIRTAIWEMPSGQVDGPAEETVEQVALRELREEAGYELAKGGNLSPSAITLPPRVSQMNGVISFWRAPYRSVKRQRQETKENRFSAAANFA